MTGQWLDRARFRTVQPGRDAPWTPRLDGRLGVKEVDMEIPGIISVDDHVVEPPDLWQRWLPSRFRDAGPRVVRMPWELGPGLKQAFRPAASGPETDFWVAGDIVQALPKMQASVGYRPEQIDFAPISYREMRPGCFEVGARLEDMDVAGVERSLCFPNICRFCGQLFLWMSDKELALACVRAYNDWIVEEWSAPSGGRLLPVCLIPLWDPIAAAAEVRRNAARDVRAVAFSELPAELGLPSIHDADGHWIPFIDACNETSTVICIHIGSSSTIPSTSTDAPNAVTIASISLYSQLALADWLFSGLLPRYPDLKLAFSESQIGWIPYVHERADRVWREGNHWAQLHPSIVEPPSSYARGRIYGCFFEDDFGIESRSAVGIDQITFETDYPHQDTTWPDTLAYVERITAGLPETDVRKILRDNAIRMLGLPETIPVFARADPRPLATLRHARPAT
jgi:predicted TIM-barrel fold metal-dependent hydrolase